MSTILYNWDMTKIEDRIIALGLVPFKQRLPNRQTNIYANVTCPICGKRRCLDYSKIVYKQQFTGLCLVCERKTRLAEKHPNWKGGETLRGNGYYYKRIYPNDPFFPMADATGYVKRARYVMAQYLGRPLLKREEVHHINMTRTDDAIENLMLLSVSDHHKLHARMRRKLRVGYGKKV